MATFDELVSSRKQWIEKVLKPWCQRAAHKDLTLAEQEWGDIAKYGLIKLIGGRRIRFQTHARDRYGRTVATLYVRRKDNGEWQNVNARMVTLGHAWVYGQHYADLPPERRNELNRLERWARSKRVGLWKHPSESSTTD